MSIKRKLYLKLYVYKTEKYNISAIIEDENQLNKKLGFDCFSINNIDDLVLEINNSLKENKKVIYDVNVYIISDSLFYINYLVLKNKKKKNISWIKEMISKDIIQNSNDYDIRFEDDHNIVVINNEVIDCINEFINGLANCNFFEITNVCFKPYIKKNKYDLLPCEYCLIIINNIFNKYYLQIYRYENMKIINNCFIVFNEYEMLEETIIQLNDQKVDTYFYVDDLFYESIVNRLKFDFYDEHFHYLNEVTLNETD